METSSPLSVAPEAILEVCLCHAARRTARGLARIYDAAFAPLGLTSGQFTLLAAVGAHGPVSVTRLSEVLLLDSSTLSRNLTPLRRTGYLVVESGSGRRAGTVELTSAGLEILGKAVTAWQGAQGAVTLKIGGSAAAGLLQLLDRAAVAVK